MERKDLKEKLPYGYAKLVAERAGVSSHSVSRFLNGYNNSVKIENATLEILSELYSQKKKLLKNIL
jgi:Transcriptional regulators